MTPKALIPVIALIVAVGCSAPPSLEPSTATSQPTSTVPPETTIATSTTLVTGPVEIPGRALVWEPGTYITNSFLVPMTFTVEAAGWGSYGAEGEWVEVGFVEEGATTVAASLVIIAYRPTESIETVLGAITSIDGVSVLSDPANAVVAGFDAKIVDLEGTPDPTFIGGGRGRECSDPAGSGRFFVDGAGYQLFSKGLSAYGIPACYLSRVWVVAVDGTTITMIGTTDDPNDFERLMAEVEHLLEGLRFEPE
jgi:hypothetical protein